MSPDSNSNTDPDQNDYKQMLIDLHNQWNSMLTEIDFQLGSLKYFRSNGASYSGNDNFLILKNSMHKIKLLKNKGVLFNNDIKTVVENIKADIDSKKKNILKDIKNERLKYRDRSKMKSGSTCLYIKAISDDSSLYQYIVRVSLSELSEYGVELAATYALDDYIKNYGAKFELNNHPYQIMVKTYEWTVKVWETTDENLLALKAYKEL